MFIIAFNLKVVHLPIDIFNYLLLLNVEKDECLSLTTVITTRNYEKLF